MDEPTDPQSSSGGTSELLDPHLPSLSKFWLAALKDKACLFLPVDLRNQLPPSKGGMFYSIDVMDDVKQYYEANWSSLLLAAAIWLQERGFHKKDEAEMGGADNGKAAASLPMPLLPESSSSTSAARSSDVPRASPSDSRLDKFHLVLGLAVQSLCMPSTLDQPHVLSNCLRTLRKLLCSEVAREVLASDSRVGIELLNVMHRLLLTSTFLPIHITAMQVAEVIGNILVQVISFQKQPEDSPVSSEAKDSNNDSETGKDVALKPEVSIQPGESCGYAILQVVACSLLRVTPNLRDSGASDSRYVSSASSPPKNEDLIVVLHAVKVLGVICGICAPVGVSSVLPPVLHLLLSTLAYMCKLGKNTGSAAVVARVMAAGLQSLGQICTMLPLSDAQVGPQLTSIVQSALVSILGKHAAQVGGAKEEAELAGMDDGTRLVVMVVLLLRTSQDVCPAPSNLFDSCVSLFKQCLRSSDSKVWGWMITVNHNHHMYV